MSGAEDSGEGERAKSSKSKKDKSKETEKQERSKETEKNKETEQCKAVGEKVTTGQDAGNNTPDSPKKDASTDPLEDAGICTSTLLKLVFITGLSPIFIQKVQCYALVGDHFYL